MKYTKQTGGGAWVDKNKLVNGSKAKIVSECVPTKEVFEGKEKIRNVVKLRVQGDPDAKNCELNRPTLNALVEAFGEESKDWINKPLEILTETVVVGGRRGKALYLIPEGFEVTTDSGNFIIIVPKGGSAQAKAGELSQVPDVTEDDFGDIGADDIGF